MISVRDRRGWGIWAIALLLMGVGCARQTSKPTTHTIQIVNMQFVPAELSVRKGDTVIWNNQDLVTHDVTEVHQKWHSPPIVSGATWKMAVQAGADYYCSIHSVMKGKLIMK